MRGIEKLRLFLHDYPLSAILDFTESGSSKLLSLWCLIRHHRAKCEDTRQMYGRVIDDKRNVFVSFRRGVPNTEGSRSDFSKLGFTIELSLCRNKLKLDFTHLTRFRNDSGSNSSAVERGQKSWPNFAVFDPDKN